MLQRIDTSRKADIRYVIGSTGAGKSSYVKAEIAADKRILIFDPDDEYGEIPGIFSALTPGKLLERLKASKGGPFRGRLVAGGVDNFEFINSAAFVWTNCTLVAEELADVTKPSWAPPFWGRVIRRGARKRAIRIFATTQRPAEVDKTIFSQATMIRTGLLGRDADRRSVAAELDVSPAEIAALNELDFLEYHKRGREIWAGNVAQNIRKRVK